MIARLYKLWLHHLRFWHIIDLDAATRSGNLMAKMDCRLRIADLDREIDNFNVLH